MIKHKYIVKEYEYSRLTDKDTKIYSTTHRTNSYLFYLLMIICFKINKIKYKVIKEVD